MNDSQPGQSAEQWGRVAEDGSVFVRTAEGERKVGQMPDAPPEEALAFYTKRYDDLAFEVQLLEQRIAAGTLAPDEATSAVDQVHTTLQDAQAVGDLAGLDARLDGLRATIEKQREQRKAERAKRVAEAKARKEKIAAEAETLAEGTDWRNGANRLRELLARTVAPESADGRKAVCQRARHVLRTITGSYLSVAPIRPDPSANGYASRSPARRPPPPGRQPLPRAADR